MPLKMRRAALRSALTVKATELGIILVDELTLAEPKTKIMAASLFKLVGDASALVLIPEKSNEYDLVSRATHNIADAKVVMAGYLNIRDLLNFDKLVMPVKSLEVLETQLG
jgi:large subunit ribosomal protein L4